MQMQRHEEDGESIFKTLFEYTSSLFESQPTTSTIPITAQSPARSQIFFNNGSKNGRVSLIHAEQEYERQGSFTAPNLIESITETTESIVTVVSAPIERLKFSIAPPQLKTPKIIWYKQEKNKVTVWDDNCVYQLNCVINDQSLFSKLLSQIFSLCRKIFDEIRKRLAKMLKFKTATQQHVTDAEDEIKTATHHFQVLQTSVYKSVHSGQGLQDVPKFEKKSKASEFEKKNASPDLPDSPGGGDDDPSWLEYFIKALKMIIKFIDDFLIPLATLLAAMATFVCFIVKKFFPVYTAHAGTVNMVCLALPAALELIKKSLGTLVTLLESIKNFEKPSNCIIV